MYSLTFELNSENKHIILKLLDVEKDFKKVRAVDGVSFEVAQGEFLALLGPNGAGKTTLVEMVEGLQKPTRGEILLNGKTWKGNERELQRFIGISLQETHFFDKTTVREILKVFASFYHVRAARIDEVLETIRLTEKCNAYVENLSGGQRQKLALGIAMLHKAQLLLLDEPTTGLDPTARREMWEILMNMRHQQQTSMILTTHYMEEAEYLCDRIIVMDNGRILAQGTLNSLLIENDCYEVIAFSTHEQLADIDFVSQAGFDRYSWDARLHCGKIKVREIVKQLPLFLNLLQQKGVSLKTLECRRMTLDDLFIEMTGRHIHEDDLNGANFNNIQ